MAIISATDFTFSVPELSNIIIQTAAVLTALAGLLRFARGPVLRWLKIDATPSDVLAAVHEIRDASPMNCRCEEELEQIIANQGSFSDALSVLIGEIVPPDTQAIQDAYHTLQRAGIVNGPEEEEELEE